MDLKDLSPTDSSRRHEMGRTCCICGKSPAPDRLPFCVGRQETPPLPKEYRFLRLGPRKKKFVQRYRWVWHTLWLCRDCGASPPSDRLWSALQNHPGTRALVEQGYTETRLGPDFDGPDGEVTFTEEPV